MKQETRTAERDLMGCWRSSTAHMLATEEKDTKDRSKSVR